MMIKFMSREKRLKSLLS
ncbi:hypothetical protein Golax_019692 [Gossypium laxum]|uniref:Uncharacterized protein n=1 Tax=Gossypium laxum TaxID=34288 RepID=A0A7J8Z781_9ROSI|nr:hypothetical protein [Gossypium laxum]